MDININSLVSFRNEIEKVSYFLYPVTLKKIVPVLTKKVVKKKGKELVVDVDEKYSDKK